VYFDKDLEAFSGNQLDAGFATAPEGRFFAHQRATYRIDEYDRSGKLLRRFGVVPKYWRDPPQVSDESTQRSVQALSEFIGSITTYWGMSYDEATSCLFLNYANLDKDDSSQRILLAGKHYMQVYDTKSYDCIMDEPIPGKMAYLRNSRIYVLKDERPEYLTFAIFTLNPK